MKWILIFWLYQSPGIVYETASATSGHVNFETESACKAAFAKMVDVNSRDLNIRGVCVNTDEKTSETPK